MRNSQHRRSLETGLFSAAISPIAIGMLLLFVFAGPDVYLLEMAIPITLVGLLISIPSTLLGAWPLFLVLRSKSLLSGLLLSLGCGLIGAIAIGVIALVVFNGSNAQSLGSWHGVLTTYLILGFAFGLVAGLALTIGAGVPFWRPTQNNNAIT